MDELLSERLWRALADLYAAGPDGLSYGRLPHGPWPGTDEERRDTPSDDGGWWILGRYVINRRPADGRPDTYGRHWLNAAGRAHIAAHADRYARLYPRVALRPPAQAALEPLSRPTQWRVLVDVATGVLASQDGPVPAVYERDGWFGESLRRVRIHLLDLRDRGLVTVDDDGRPSLTEGGRAHYAAHHADYTRRWTDILAPRPADLTI